MPGVGRRGCGAPPRGREKGSTPRLSTAGASAGHLGQVGGGAVPLAEGTASAPNSFLSPRDKSTPLLTSSTGRTFAADLFGEPIVLGIGRGRPPHVPTPARRALVIELRATGATAQAIARALGVCRATLYRDYPQELGVRTRDPSRPADNTSRRGGASQGSD